MHKQNILELADFLEKAEFIFDMGSALANPECGAAGCIGGHAAVLWEELRQGSYSSVGYTFNLSKLGNKLELKEQLTTDLCFNPHDEDGIGMSCLSVTRSMAVATLRRLAETGELYFEEE